MTGADRPWSPGQVLSPDREVVIGAGLERVSVAVRNTSARPVRVSSHYPFWRANARLDFDREASAGFRLDVPAGSSIRWAPGEVREVTLVASFADPRGGVDAAG